MSLIDFCSCTNSVEDVAHHFRFVQEHAVAGGLAVALPDIRETVGRTAQGADLTVARTMDLAASRPLQDLRALVLRDHALHLHEQLVLRRLARRAVEEDRRDPLLAQLVEQQHLVGVLARQAVGAVHVQPVDASLGDPIAQPLERGPHQRRAAEAVVEVNVLGQQHVAVGRHALLERRDLAVDRGLLRLLLGRNARVNRDRLHRLPPCRRRTVRRSHLPTTGRSAPAAIVRSTAGLTTWYTARRCVADMRVGENAVRISIPRRICADTLHPSTLVSRKRRIPARPPR